MKKTRMKKKILEKRAEFRIRLALPILFAVCLLLFISTAEINNSSFFDNITNITLNDNQSNVTNNSIINGYNNESNASNNLTIIDSNTSNDSLLSIDSNLTPQQEKVINLLSAAGALSTVNVSIIYPSSNINVLQGRFFNVTTNVTCLTQDCGDVNVTLDPAGTPYTVCLWDNATNCGGNLDLSGTNLCSYGYNTAAIYSNSTTVTGATIVTNVTLVMWHTACSGEDISFRLNGALVHTFSDSVDCTCTPSIGVKWPETYTLNSTELSTFSSNWLIGTNNNLSIIKGGTFHNSLSYANITYLSGKQGAINTSVGAIPFYTNISTNPYTVLGLNASQSQTVNFWVNATSSTGTYDFFAIANITAFPTNGSISNHFNVTIVSGNSSSVSLLSPSNGYSQAGASFNASCNVSSLNVTGLSLTNITLLVWNAQGTLIIQNTTNASGYLNYTANYSTTLPQTGTEYLWNCQANNTFGDSFTAPSNRTIIIQGESGDWWRSSYTYRKNIVINATSVALPSDYSVNITVNTSALVSAGKMQASGKDFRIVYNNGTNTEIDRVNVTLFNTQNTQVFVKLQAAISANQNDSNYWLYYGNPSETIDPPVNGSNVFLFYDNFNDGTLDTNKWKQWTAGSSSVSVSSNALYVHSDGSNRAHASTNKNFTYPIQVDYIFYYPDGGDMMQVDTRSDGQGQGTYDGVNNGMEFFGMNGASPPTE